MDPDIAKYIEDMTGIVVLTFAEEAKAAVLEALADKRAELTSVNVAHSKIVELDHYTEKIRAMPVIKAIIETVEETLEEKVEELSESAEELETEAKELEKTVDSDNGEIHVCAECGKDYNREQDLKSHQTKTGHTNPPPE